MSTDYIGKAVKAEREVDWSALKADRCLSVWVVHTLKRCVVGAMSNDAGKIRGPGERDVEEPGLSEDHRHALRG